MHALWRQSAALAAACVFAACAGGDVTAPNGTRAPGSPDATILVTPSNDTLTVGDTVRLSVTATTLREARHPVTYTSSDTTIVRVDATGLVTAVGAGTATVSVASTVSGSTAPALFDVRPNIARVVLAPDTLRLALGDSATIGFHAYDGSGQITWSFDSTAVTWSSTVPSVATVRQSGKGSAVVKGLAKGHSHIIVSLASHADTIYALVDSSATSSATTSKVSSVTVTLNSSTLTVGQTTQAVAVARDSSGTVLSGLATTGSSADTTIATVSTSGLVTARKAGSAAIKAVVSGVAGSATLTVASSTAASVTVTSNAASIAVGQSTQLTATVRDASGATVSGATVTWASSAPSVASVSSAGLVTGVAAGGATITATSGSVSGSVAITVTVTSTTTASTGSVAAPPALPRVYLNTAMPSVTGQSINVPAGGDLQAALNQAQPGDEIVLQAGATYTGNFNLPAKSGAGTMPGNGPVVVVRSSGIGSLPAGRRVSPADAQYMAKVVTNLNGGEVFGTSPGAAGWRFVGLEITASPSVTLLGRLVRFGDGNPTQNTASQVPMNLVLDRSYVHATPTVDIRRCVDLQSGASAVIDSYLSECHSVGSDAQAIASWNGPGPYKIVDNYLEGSGENVMFGGADVYVPNQLPSDIEVRGNYFNKPLTWKQDDPSYAGTAWGIKNLFELKMGQRILVEGNVFEHVWVNAQVGFALLLKTSNDQAFPTTDVTVRHNIVRGAAGAVNVAGIEAPIYRVVVSDNLFLDIGSAQWDPTTQNGRLFQAFNAQDVTFAHNVGFAPQMFGSLDSPTSPRLDFRDNIVGHGIYGFKGSGIAEGTATLATYAPGYAFPANVIASGGDPSLYPAGNYFAATVSSIGFVNSTGTTANDYALLSTSPYKGKATDGSDPGIDAAALSTATATAKP